MLSNDGYIQCSITHTTTSARYTCLSYRWGELDISKQHSIVINGRLCLVRENLVNFLHVMRSTAPRDDPIFDPMTGYWIDALSIDQENTAEKNHQVAQMGSIYSHAEKVHVWLGSIPKPLPDAFLQLIKGRDVEAGPLHDALMAAERKKWAAQHDHSTSNPRHSGLHHWASFSESDLDFVVLHILQNEYWTRAWVVQEMLLAQHVDVSLNDRRISFPNLLQRLRVGSIDWSNSPLQAFALQAEGLVEYRGHSLIQLMERFRGVKCSLIQDRVFALLSLCDDRYAVSVCYELSVDQLAVRVLLSETICMCSARSVAQSLELGNQENSQLHKGCRVYLEFDLYDYTLEWTDPDRRGSAASCRRPGLSLKRGIDQYFVLKEWGGPDLSFNTRSMYRKEPLECIDKWCARFCEHIINTTDLEAMLCVHYAGTDDIFCFDITTVLHKSLPHDETAMPLPGHWKELSPDWVYRISTDRNLCTVRVPISETLKMPSFLDELCSRRSLHTDGTQLVRVSYC